MCANRHSDQDADDRKAKIDHHKDDQLNKQKEGKGHWKKELGSNSESAVRTADIFWRNWNIKDRKITAWIGREYADELGHDRSRPIEKRLRMRNMMLTACRRRRVRLCRMTMSMGRIDERRAWDPDMI